MVEPQAVRRRQRLPPSLNGLSVGKTGEQAAASALIKPVKARVAKPVGKLVVVAAAFWPVRVRGPHCLGLPDKQCLADRDPIGPSPVLFQARPSINSRLDD